jgi:hypothetical protein
MVGDGLIGNGSGGNGVLVGDGLVGNGVGVAIFVGVGTLVTVTVSSDVGISKRVALFQSSVS